MHMVPTTLTHLPRYLGKLNGSIDVESVQLCEKQSAQLHGSKWS